MPDPIAFVQPESIEAVLETLHTYGDDARLVAGATAVTIMLRERLIRPRALVSLGGLHGLNQVRHDDGYLTLGALTTHRQVELSPVVQTTVPVLAEAFRVVGNVRVRNAATVGGVLAEADYASDPPAVFLALDAEVQVVGPAGSRSIRMDQFVTGFYETALQPDEILTEIRVPVPAPGTHGAYMKYVTRSSEDRPCLGAVALVRMAADGATCADLRVAVGAAAEVPQRFPEVEALARGHELDQAVISAVADGYAERIETLSDMRGSSWYRTEMIRVWVRRAIQHAWEIA